eukprot:TRINITY_DN1989_c1_g1_i1.p1 TRINITY_DN1989_c1_g1~~TRINITY_DN1989_c1_g1_i1.p1  ORF type:complete len:185 (-),score=42.14 TRINITY_DN1989_c1_g1_i1:1038-1592(-)
MAAQLSHSLLQGFLFCFLLFLGGSVSSPSYVDDPPEDAVLCPLAEYVDAKGENVQEYFQCPGLEDESHFTACCADKCCPYRSVDSVLQIDIRIAMVISLAVIILCIISGITIIICCFVSSCPLYDTCSGDAAWGTEGGYMPGDMHPLTLNGMPSETEENLQKKYKILAFESKGFDKDGRKIDHV